MSVPESVRLVSVKLTPVGRPQSFFLDDLPTDRVPTAGDRVVVQADNGPSVGTVVRAIPQLASKRRPPAGSARHLVRLETRDDVLTRARHERREREAFRVALLKIRERGLGMKLARVDQVFDGSRLVFHFTAEARVDFRELVRELAAEFRTRIEMRQIGVRDEAKMLGGYGTCGRPLCCCTWLGSFEPVSIKMAKQQDLSLNPSMLFGLCGRLKCCLRYELPNAKGAAHRGSGSEGGCGDASSCGQKGPCAAGGHCEAGENGSKAGTRA